MRLLRTFGEVDWENGLEMCKEVVSSDTEWFEIMQKRGKVWDDCGREAKEAARGYCEMVRNRTGE